jgi:hypothetical protein
MPNSRLEIAGLAEAIAASSVTPKHEKLIATLRSFELLKNARLATTRDGYSLVKRKVMNADGTVVHEDHEAWFGEQIAADGGDAGRTYERLKGAGYLLSHCGLTTLYLVHDQATDNPAEFVQAEVLVEDEWTDRHLLSDWTFRTPQDVRDLMEQPGLELDQADRKRVRPMAYHLQKVVDIGIFIAELDTLESEKNELHRGHKLRVFNMAAGTDRMMSFDELNPGWDRRPTKARRFFLDWAASSAGRSGARLCEKWVIQTSDHTDAKGERWMSIIPAWTFTQKLAKVEGRKGSAYELYGQLQKLDRRVGVPFAWYFYMLHGNRVHDESAYRVIKAAERGEIVLPEHDYQVLKAWNANPYGY